MTHLTTSPEGFISICNRATVLRKPAALTLGLSSDHLEGIWLRFRTGIWKTKAVVKRGKPA